jgi:hypothetical protein
MGKRAPRLPVASAERERVTISDSDWRRIESAYGQKLLPEVRRDIHEKTQKFVDRAEFEQNAELVSDARNRIVDIITAASSLRSKLDSGNHDVDIYARTLIKKHLLKEGDAKKHLRKGDPSNDAFRSISSEMRLLILASRKRRRKKDDAFRGISSDMRRLIFACQDALKELNNTKDEDFKKGEAWNRWSNELTDIAKAHGLPWRVRKDSDKQKSRSSPFVEFVWELQQSVPKAHRRYSRGALAVVIVGARRQNRVK